MQVNSPEIVVYSQNNCAYCESAKKLLDSKGLAYTVRNLTTDAGAKAEMFKSAPGARTVPQIVIGGKLIGGFDMLQKYLARG